MLFKEVQPDKQYFAYLFFLLARSSIFIEEMFVEMIKLVCYVQYLCYLIEYKEGQV